MTLACSLGFQRLNHRWNLPVILGFATLLVARTVHAYEPGDTVVVTQESLLSVSGQPRDKVFPGQVLRVGATQGPWLWVGDGKPGWLDSRQVLPLSQAKTHFTRLVRRSASAANFFARGLVMSAIGDLDQALEDFDQAIRRDSSQAACYEARGFVWMDKGDCERAVQDFNRSISINAKSAFAFAGRALVWLESEELDKAIKDCDTSIQLDSEYASPYIYRGIALMQKGEFETALTDLDTAVHLYPQDALSYRYRAQVYFHKRDYDRALADFAIAIRFDPTDPESHNGLGVVWQAKAEFEQAIRAYGKAIQLQPDAAHVISNRGQALMEKGAYGEALADLDRAISLDATFAEALGHRAWLRATCPLTTIRDGQRARIDAQAFAHLRKAADFWVCRCVAATNAELGDFNRAVRWQKEALALFPESNIPARYRTQVLECLTCYEQGRPYRAGQTARNAWPPREDLRTTRARTDPSHVDSNTGALAGHNGSAGRAYQ